MWVGRAASLLIMLGAWALAAHWVADPQTLPTPLTVGGIIVTEARNGDLAHHMIATLGRVTAAFLLAMSAGLAAGLALGRRPGLNAWVDNLLVVMLNLPALVVIVLCYVWIGLNEVAAITAVALNKIPMVTLMIREGARAVDAQLSAMVRVYRPSAVIVLRDVMLPQMAPQIAAAGRSGLALIWKIVLVVEFLGRPDGVGFQIHLGFQLFDVGLVLAYALCFVVVMLCVEGAILRPWEARANRWRLA
ncbi:ABC transporter permease subunit [Mesobacterium sp. TK19101]|uniref:ABC transporter permease subunit n=1 Tax=Mesobacterium hydrothermale TaxID=3111907 RepID=A0ABU6HGY7_9RHOB|nr:ABC transporter permease subunit [Mesobacterium sp. TK19101]MEC3861723.1 ABC transporter permease subunit [Mesobacterium sp. TK19101]